MASLVLHSFGASVALDGPPDVLDRLTREVRLFATSEWQQVEPDLTVIAAEGSDDYLVSSVGGQVERSGTLAQTVDILMDLVHPRISQHATEATFIHAAAFAWHDQLVLVPGRSGSGKSTLARAAIEAGASYFSDEFAPVDRDGLVWPYPRPLVMRIDGARMSFDPAWLTDAIASTPRRAAVILDTTYRAGATWNPAVRDGASVALTLVDNAVRARDRPEDTLRAASMVTARSVSLIGERGDAREVVAYLDAELRAGQFADPRSSAG